MSKPLLKYREPVAAQDVLTEAVPARFYTEGSGLNLARAALFGVNLDRVADIVDLLRTYRGGRPNSLIMGGPMGWSWYSTLDTAHHGSLAGPANAHRHSDLANIGIDDHHARDHATRHHSGGADALALGSIAGNLTDAQHGSRTVANAHAHSHLSGVGANDHHARDHVLATNTGLGATHTMSGATAGHVLRATSATAAQFAQLQHGDLGGVGINDHHARDHAATHLVGGADALSVGTPVNIGTANAAGTATNFARRDHVHNHPSGLGANLHHNQNHNLIDTTGHPVSGLTAGHFLKATGATAYAFQAHGLSAGDVGAEPAIGAGTTAQYWRGDKSWQTLLGETSATAYRGDRGKTAYDHSQNVTGAVHGAVSAATANMIARRDSGGRARFAAPAASGDALIKGTAITDTEHGVRTLANAHAHSHLSGIGVNDHHARDHVLATNTGLGATHTISGAAAGQVLRASSASAANFQQLAHADLGGVTADQHHAAFTSADHAAIGDGAPHHAENHASRHLVGGADALSVGVPVNIGTANAAGTATNFARRDHVHAHPSGLGANLHHNQNHNLIDTTGHPVSGLTAGQFLKATGATTYAFQAHGLSAGDVGAAAVIHNLIDTTNHPVSGLTIGHVIRASGATAYAFAQLQHGDLGGVTADQHHAAFTSADHTAIGDGAPHHARDHATRHQDGGADEISLAGLDGEPSTLTTHKSATTGIHGVGASTVESASGAQAKVDTHAGLTTAHSAVSTATASRIVVRDASARAKFAAPAASGDALIKGTKITTTELPNLTSTKIWQGNASNRPVEVSLPAAGAVIASGSYTGDSTENRGIAHGLGVTPKFIFHVRRGLKPYGFQGNSLGNIYQSSSTTVYVVTDPDATNFYVGDAASYADTFNLNTVVYDWVAIG